MPDTGTLSALATAALLGVAHGFDADHVATIDGLARWHAWHGQAREARRAGAAFSLGHGLVVIAVTALAAWAGGFHVPAWAEASGIAVSLTLLICLGWINLRHAWRDHAHAPIEGLRLRFANWARARLGSSGLAAWLTGALFAISFDTLTQAAGFALAGAAIGSGGLGAALGLSIAFVAGMLVADGCNGALIAWLIARGARFARLARRGFALLVALAAWGVAGLTLSRLAAGRLDTWLDDHALVVGLGLVALVAAGYGAAALIDRRTRANPSPERAASLTESPS